MIDINWQKKSPTEEVADYEGLRLRTRKTGNITVYFIERDGEVQYNTRDKFDFLRHLEMYIGRRKHLSVRQNRI